MSGKVGRAGGVFEDDTLGIALANTFRFGAINAYWSFFAALDSTLSACCLQLVHSVKAIKVLTGQTNSSILSLSAFWKLSAPVEAHSALSKPLHSPSMIQLPRLVKPEFAPSVNAAPSTTQPVEVVLTPCVRQDFNFPSHLVMDDDDESKGSFKREPGSDLWGIERSYIRSLREPHESSVGMSSFSLLPRTLRH
jgi:hypothetical protein